MVDRLSTNAADTEHEASRVAAKRKSETWVVWFVIATSWFAIMTSMLGPRLGHLLRAPWARLYAIDVMRFLLVFSVVMIAVALWRIYVLKRPRV
jgi:hypothetical protein